MMIQKYKNVSRETCYLLIVLFLSSFLTINATEYPVVFSESVMVADAQNGSIYYGKNGEVPIETGNFTKLMTAYVAYDYLVENKIELQQPVKVSSRAASLKNQSLEVTGGYYEAGESLTYQDLFELMLIANDDTAAIVIAESVAGTEAKFVELMNKKSKALGLKNTVYYNVTGLPASEYGVLDGIEKKNNSSTPKDQMKVAQNLVLAYPDTLAITSKTGVDRKGQLYTTTNQLLPGGNYEKNGVKGLATGYTPELGSSIIVYYTPPEKENSYLISIFGASNSDSRFIETQTVIDWVQKITTVPYLEDLTEVSHDLLGDTKGNRNFVSNTSFSKVEDYDVDIYTDNIVYNPLYFDETGMQQKEIPAGEVVFTIEFGSFVIDEANDIRTSIPKTLSTEDDLFSVDYVSRETIYPANILQKLYTAIIRFFQELINEII